MGKKKAQYQDKLKVDLLEFYRFMEFVSTIQLVFKIHCHGNLKREQWRFVEKTKASCLYKCTDNFSIRDNAIYQLGYN